MGLKLNEIFQYDKIIKGKIEHNAYQEDDPLKIQILLRQSYVSSLKYCEKMKFILLFSDITKKFKHGNVKNISQKNI